MAEPQPQARSPFDIDYSQFVIEDDQPVDNVFSEKQMRLLVETLYTSWDHPQFAALANVGIFVAVKQPPIVPDVMVCLNVVLNPGTLEKKDLSYFAWEHGKLPEIVIEVVSNREGHEDTTKKARYAEIGIAHYVIYDPDLLLSKRVLRAYERHATQYVDMVDAGWMPTLGLGLMLWEGAYEGSDATWLRWIDRDRKLLLTGAERARQAEDAARSARSQAEAAKSEAEAAKSEAERLRRKLRELGLDPDAK